jgi:apolipoprotein N-acyltransferase
MLTLLAGAGLLASAVLYGLAFPPTDIALCARIALVPFLIVVRRVRPWAALGGAIVFALAACATTIGWLPRAAAGYFQQPFLFGFGTWLSVAVVMIAPAVVLFTIAYRAIAAWPPWTRPLLGAAAWAATELFRTRLLGNPFALLGATQTGTPLAIQIGDLSGVYGIGFAVAAVNIALAEAWLAWHADRPWRPVMAPIAAAAACVALQFGYGVARLGAAPARDAAEPVQAVLVQGNVDLGTQWRDEFFGRNLDIYLRLTLDAIRARPAQLVVWPENAMSFFIADEPLYREAIGRVLSFGGVELVAGGPTVASPNPERFFNSAFALQPDGQIRGRYDKQRLLPFAEYFPLPELDVLRRNFGRVREFTVGGPAELLPSTAGPAGVLICNEILFPELAAARVRAGAAYLINLTNDGWIGDRTYAHEALDVAVLRAVEQRRWLLRVSTSGPSAIIDPYGRIVALTAFNTRTALAGGFAPQSAVTAYARLGDAFAVMCAVVVAAVLGGALRARFRSPSP